ncbi:MULTISPECIES: protein-glutamate methylesterase/protein-glutamine glutaminase [unclassified Aureimonas]|uniref:protein-glutamate methylesterase/protein-glutamine glutaminase n=1 Tax=unclassified Aureimonas TaxID=2615206 RepID=UPI0006FDA480|nr:MULTISPECIES: chemotaxis response regulator protein-glutamate methylesterase [unclassified Aureimonas]KQT69078.1 two-component system response regulator protein-glutamate methylesterase [Aureimonas sp. Leaf460]KQT69316.1 two-component system response regulator protein-glutamate methylesterase [Aureimonas sp. Leaf427]
MTKLLIVDDSALMRKYLREIFEADGTFEVATARNGRDALAQIAQFNPDVVTLDVNMPEMDGITCLAAIMTDTPRPVVMVSSITTRGAEVTLEALKLGAVDYVEKPGGTVSLNIDQIAGRLVQTVKAAAKAKPRRSRNLVERVRNAARSVPEPRPASAEAAAGLVLIGVSTGGPRTIEDILPELPAGFPLPIVVAQHMPAAFTASFAARLDSICRIQVTEVSGPTQLKAGHAYIGRGNADVVVETRLGRPVVNVAAEEPSHLWHPSVERLVRTAMRAFDPRRLVAVQLTGMGNDGAQAMAELRQAGGHTIAEHESTAIVYGMPAELVRLGGAEKILPSDRIADQLISWSK